MLVEIREHWPTICIIVQEWEALGHKIYHVEGKKGAVIHALVYGERFMMVEKWKWGPTPWIMVGEWEDFSPHIGSWWEKWGELAYTLDHNEGDEGTQAHPLDHVKGNEETLAYTLDHGGEMGESQPSHWIIVLEKDEAPVLTLIVVWETKSYTGSWRKKRWKTSPHTRLWGGQWRYVDPLIGL